MTKITKFSIPITEDIEGFPMPILSFALYVFECQKLRKEIEKGLS